jgi:hypothetical protein
VTQHTLINALDNQLEKQRIDAKFDFSQERYQVKTFCAESELAAFLEESGTFQVTIGRFRCPRINAGSCYWPPSERALTAIGELMQAYQKGEIPDPRPIDFAQIEGQDISKIWEPMWSGHPSVKKKN